MAKKRAIIIGAGPAGLTAALELLRRTDIAVSIYETSDDFGGIAKSVFFKGNILDIGGHRYFSNSERVKRWWEEIFPLQGAPAKDYLRLNRFVPISEKPNAPDPQKEDRVMLIRHRVSRILFQKKLIDYPLTFDWKTFLNIGLLRTVMMVMSYLKARIFPVKEKNLEDFFINRFGKILYSFFFKSYTQKLWGVPSNQLSSEWGRQRVKTVSVPSLLVNAFKRIFLKKDLPKLSGVNQQEASLIEYFWYPKFGAGQIWQESARLIKEKGGEIYLKHKVTGINFEGNKITGIDFKDMETGQIANIKGDYFLSSMPIKELIECFSEDIPLGVREAAGNLKYRDFITVGLLLKKLKVKNRTKIKTINNLIPDNWIYVQEKELKLGRIQLFNNWSPYLVKNNDNVWLGLEYFCSQDDEFWNKNDQDIAEFAQNELFKAGLAVKEDVLDSIVVKTVKAYPVYCNGYSQMNIIRDFVDNLKNLFLIGRNGMHKYNNMDHSMLTAMVAVDNIISERRDKDNIWSVNA